VLRCHTSVLRYHTSMLRYHTRTFRRVVRRSTGHLTKSQFVLCRFVLCQGESGSGASLDACFGDCWPGSAVGHMTDRRSPIAGR
jgi:hypothetical protein